MAMIGRACFDNATFMTIDAYPDTYTIPATNKTTTSRSFKQRHGMMKGNGYQYEYFKGGKTGFTDESGYTLITFAQKDDMRLICVTMKEASDEARYIDTKALFDYGFGNFSKAAVSSNDVSSLFNTSNYYNSKVYGNSTISFSMASSFVDLPSGVSFSDTTITVEPNEASSDNLHDFTADIVFSYNEHKVGSAKLLVSTNDTAEQAANLPYIFDDSAQSSTSRRCLVINIWHIIAIMAVILIVFEIYEEITAARRRNRRRRRRMHNLRR